MATLISVYGVNGCIGRCDEKCHSALKPVCTCICGGVNHGVGVGQARKNSKALADEKIKENVTDKRCEFVHIFREEQQLELFKQGT